MSREQAPKCPLLRIRVALRGFSWFLASLCLFAILSPPEGFAQAGNGPTGAIPQTTYQTLPIGSINNGAATNPLGASINIKAGGSLCPGCTAVGGAKKTITAVTTNASSTITDATNSPWLASDVGKKIYCIGSNSAVALSVTIATIATFNSTSSISVAPATGNGNASSGSSCVWFTQKDTTAFQAASTAATTTLTSVNGVSGALLGYSGSVYCPHDGYVVDGPFFIQNSANNGTLGASFIGDNQGGCTIFISPDVAASSNSWGLNSVQNYGATYANFTVDCATENLTVAAPMIRITNAQHTYVHNVEFDSCGTSGDNVGILDINNDNDIVLDQVRIAWAGLGGSTSTEPPLAIASSQGVMIRNFTTTNPGATPSSITNSCPAGGGLAGGPRGSGGSECTIENSTFDEGGNPGCLSLVGSSINLIGVTCFEGTAQGITLDGNSSAYMTDVNIVPFGGSCSGGTRNAIVQAANSLVQAGGSTIQGCGATGAVSGPSTAKFVDVGGNEIRNCPGGPPCPLVTAATYAANGFTGGIVPTAAIQMPTNTYYAVTGNLLATAQNLASFTLTKNQQITGMSAQSGGTTPSNSTCATPPVITVSDGTRSATMTMTSGKTFWTSTVDANTSIPGQVFASGATLTISIGANTCATPPSNVSVSVQLQSVLSY